MARLPLRQAADPSINDRWNQHDDDELCDLIDCGPGLVPLPVPDLKAAALDLSPDHPFASAEFAEVAWRAGRLKDALEILITVRAATPDPPSHAVHLSILDGLIAAVTVDVEAASGVDWTATAANATALAKALTEGRDSEVSNNHAASVAASTRVRHALAAAGTVTGTVPAATLEPRPSS
jgi:hypothetical protein